MGSVQVVVGHELGQHRSDLLLAQRQDVIQALPAEGPHNSFPDGVRPGRLSACPDALDAEPGEPGGEVGTVGTVAVVDQVPGVLAPGRGLDHLAPDPCGGRVRGHVEVEQAAVVVADQEEDVESRNVRVWTTKKSAAQMVWAWLARKVRQLWLGGRAGPRRR